MSNFYPQPLPVNITFIYYDISLYDYIIGKHYWYILLVINTCKLFSWYLYVIITGNLYLAWVNPAYSPQP